MLQRYLVVSCVILAFFNVNPGFAASTQTQANPPIDLLADAGQEKEIPLWRKLLFVPGTVLNDVVRKLDMHKEYVKGTKSAKAEFVYKKLAEKNSTLKDSCSSAEFIKFARKGKNELDAIGKNESYQKLTEAEKRDLASLMSDATPKFKRERTKFSLPRDLADAFGRGWYYTDNICDLITNSVIYKFLHSTGKAPNPKLLKYLLRVTMIADPVLTGRRLFAWAEFFHNAYSLKKLVFDKMQEHLNPDYVELGDDTNFFQADKIDSLAAIPAVAELMALKFASSAIAAAAIDGNSGFSIGEIGKSIENSFNGDKNMTGIKGKLAPKRLSKQAFWKDDMLSLAKYARVLVQRLIAFRLFRMDNPAVFGKIFKYSLGLFDPRTISFAVSTAFLSIMENSRGLIKGVLNLKQLDQEMVQDYLLRREYRDCLFDPVDEKKLFDKDKVTGKIKQNDLKLREPHLIFGRFALQTVTERVLGVVLDKLQIPVARALDKSLHIKNWVIKMLQKLNPALTKDILHQMFFKMNAKERKQFELNLAQFVDFLPYKVVVDDKKLDILVFHVTEKGGVWEQISTDQLFQILSVTLDQPSLIISGERSKIFSNLIAKILARSIVTPLVENLLVKGLNSALGESSDKNSALCFSKRKTKFGFSFGAVVESVILASGWISLGLLRHWITEGTATPPAKPKLQKANA